MILAAQPGGQPDSMGFPLHSSPAAVLVA